MSNFFTSVIPRVVHIRGWVGGSGVDGGGEWAAGGGLSSPLGLFELAIYESSKFHP